MTAIIERWHQGRGIAQHAADGYLDADAMAAAVGKCARDWFALEDTKVLLSCLALTTGARVDSGHLPLLRDGGQGQIELNPKAAVPYAFWLGPVIGAECLTWVADWFARAVQGAPGTGPAVGAWSELADGQQRAADWWQLIDAIPEGHWTIPLELAQGLTLRLHGAGLRFAREAIAADHVEPLFLAYLDQIGLQVGEFSQVWHACRRQGSARRVVAFPDYILPVWRSWFRNDWLPTHGQRLLGSALEYTKLARSPLVQHARPWAKAAAVAA